MQVDYRPTSRQFTRIEPVRRLPTVPLLHVRPQERQFHTCQRTVSVSSRRDRSPERGDHWEMAESAVGATGVRPDERNGTVANLDAEVLAAFLDRLRDLPTIAPEVAVELRSLLDVDKLPSADQVVALLGAANGEAIA